MNAPLFWIPLCQTCLKPMRLAPWARDVVPPWTVTLRDGTVSLLTTFRCIPCEGPPPRSPHPMCRCYP